MARKSKKKRDVPLIYPWDVLVSESTPAERRLLFELRRLCIEAGFDVNELVEKSGELPEHACARSHDITELLDALGTWRRLETLITSGGYHRLPERKS